MQLRHGEEMGFIEKGWCTWAILEVDVVKSEAGADLLRKEMLARHTNPVNVVVFQRELEAGGAIIGPLWVVVARRKKTQRQVASVSLLGGVLCIKAKGSFSAELSRDKAAYREPRKKLRVTDPDWDEFKTFVLKHFDLTEEQLNHYRPDWTKDQT